MGNGNTKDGKEKTIVAKNIKNAIALNSKHFLKLKQNEIFEDPKGSLLYEIEREDFKLSTDILKKFEKFNAFSREDDG